MNSPIQEQEEVQIHRRRNWIATAVTLCVLLALSWFAWRIFSFARQIREGTLDVSLLATDGFTSSIRLAAIPITDQPVDVFSIDDPSLGRVDAPLTVVEFADFGCPYSRDVSFTLRELAIQYPEKFHYIYRDFPIVELHPIAQKASEAGECAKKQGRFWDYHDKLFQNQSDLSLQRLFEFASELNLNTNQFTNCLNSGEMAHEVEEDYQVGLKAGVRGTPTFFLNGVKVEGAIPKDLFEQLILSEE